VPRAKRIAVLVDPSNKSAESTLRDVDAAAGAMGLQIQIHNASTNREIDAAFASFVHERPDALFVSSGPAFIDRRIQLALLAAFHRLPATYSVRENAEAGGLMSYGPSLTDVYRQVGIYSGRKRARRLGCPAPVLSGVRAGRTSEGDVVPPAA
jgi:putative ABC transport system substrate-binding protein